MDLVSEMLLLNLRKQEGRLVDASELRPAMTRRLTRLPLVGATATADAADRIINRVWDYPRWLSPQIADFDLFHIIDHSYAHLAVRLPAGRSIVTCHDLDAFRGAVPGHTGGSLAERALGRKLLEGMRAAAKVLCVTDATRRALISSTDLPADRVAVVPNGVHPACSARIDPDADREAGALVGPRAGERVELLHVGSTIPRKRIDVLLRVVAAVRRQNPHVQLIQIGGALTRAQRRLAVGLDLADRVTVLPFVKPRVLAAIYRRAALLLQTSDREGFGLPVAEAMSCGTPVVATDLPALREVGGAATTYCPVADVDAWTTAIARLLGERQRDSARWRARQVDGTAWAQRYDWRAHARATVEIYREVLAGVDSGDGQAARGVA